MLEEVKQILSNGVDFYIKESPIALLRCYSKLYMQGRQTRWCEASQRKYFTQLKKNGIDMAKQYDEAQTRTCVPAYKGKKYISAKAKMYYADLLTDADAIDLLNCGYLVESDFTKLPEGYGKVEIKETPGYTEAEQNCIEEFSMRLIEGESKTSIKKSCEGVEIDGKKATKKQIDTLIKAAFDEISE